MEEKLDKLTEQVAEISLLVTKLRTSDEYGDLRGSKYMELSPGR